MRTILFMMDSLNRRYLPAYGNPWVRTPNMDRLARRSCVFDNHYVGSAPCMPARHDLLTGRLDFLERNWSPVQPFDCTLPYMLGKHGVFSHMVTDHYHYFHLGGENYHAHFGSWDFIRGQENDVWVSDLGKLGQRPHYGQDKSQYRLNRQRFHSEADYPSPKTLRHAAQWLEEHHGDDDWFLLVDSFDPHEPFFVQEEYRRLYPDDYDGPRFDWPDYTRVTEPLGAQAHCRRQYGALLTMCDAYLGRLLDDMDRWDMWKDTMLIVATDHGFLLGEHGWWAKNRPLFYEELSHTPLFIWDPREGRTGQQREALVQTIDLAPTLLGFFGVTPPADMFMCI